MAELALQLLSLPRSVLKFSLIIVQGDFNSILLFIDLFWLPQVFIEVRGLIVEVCWLSLVMIRSRGGGLLLLHCSM